MSTHCNGSGEQQEFSFGKHFRRQVTARFDGGKISSDGGAPLLGEVDRRLGLLEPNPGGWRGMRRSVRG